MKILKLAPYLALTAILAVFVAACGAGMSEEPTATPAPVAPTDTSPGGALNQGSTEEPDDQPVVLKRIPRNRTLYAAGNWTDEPLNYDKWSPYCAGGCTFQKGVTFFYEPLWYYNGLGNREYPWLATSFEYNVDSTQLTYTLREGVTWSDGEEFNADDVAFTFESLMSLGGEVRNGKEVQDFVERVETIDNYTVRLYFSRPAPKFHDFVTHKGDSGIWIVPEHDWRDKDWASYSVWRDGIGPITTSPWRVAFADPTQRVIDRVASCDDWWACSTGFQDLPEVERFVLLSNLNETQYVESAIRNQVDTTWDVQPSNSQRALAENMDATTWTGETGPYGLVSWWPTQLLVNHADEHLGKPEVRKAINYYIDRDRVIQFGLNGNGYQSDYPWPSFGSMDKYENSVSSILERSGVGQYDPGKGDEILTASGYTKDSDDFWVDSTGSRIVCEIIGTDPHFTGSGPTIAELLKQNGIQSSFSTPPDKWARAAEGNYTCDMRGNNGGHKDPYLTLRLYQTGIANSGVTGWSNPEFDAIVEELAVLNPVDQADEFEAKVLAAMEIWYEELPDIPLLQFLNSPIRSTKYWTGWPTESDPYMNGLFLHTGFPYTLLQLKATGAE